MTFQKQIVFSPESFFLNENEINEILRFFFKTVYLVITYNLNTTKGKLVTKRLSPFSKGHSMGLVFSQYHGNYHKTGRFQKKVK